MRGALTITIATLTLGLTSQPKLSQARPEIPALESVYMIDTMTGWAVTSERARPSGELTRALLQTTDGGARWRDVTPTRSPGRQIRVVAVAVLTSRIAWVSIQTSPDLPRIFHTADSGRTWTGAKVSKFGVSSIYFVNSLNGWAIADAVGFMGGGMEVNIYRSTDGGANWTRVASACEQTTPICKNTPANENSGLPLHGHKVDITFLNTTTGWVTGTILYVTHDAGRTWREQKLPLPPVVTSSWEREYDPPKFFTAQDGIMPVFYLNAQSTSSKAVAVFYATHDGGTTWRYATPVFITQGYLDCQHYTCRRYRSSSFADMNHGWIADGGALYMTSDGGRQWTKVRIPLLANVRALQFITPQVGLAVREDFPFLLKTIDGGHTWAPVSYSISP